VTEAPKITWEHIPEEVQSILDDIYKLNAKAEILAWEEGLQLSRSHIDDAILYIEEELKEQIEEDRAGGPWDMLCLAVRGAPADKRVEVIEGGIESKREAQKLIESWLYNDPDKLYTLVLRPTSQRPKDAIAHKPD
jgi:hypothetical protein